MSMLQAIYRNHDEVHWSISTVEEFYDWIVHKYLYLSNVCWKAWNKGDLFEVLRMNIRRPLSLGGEGFDQGSWSQVVQESSFMLHPSIWVKVIHKVLDHILRRCGRAVASSSHSIIFVLERSFWAEIFTVLEFKGYRWSKCVLTLWGELSFCENWEKRCCVELSSMSPIVKWSNLVPGIELAGRRLRKVAAERNEWP